MNLLKSTERFVKKILTLVLKIIIKQEVITADRIDPNIAGKVLIIRQDRRIGNLILTTPLLRKSKMVFANAKIDVLISKSGQPLYDDNPYIHQIYAFDHKGFIKNPLKLFGLISTLRKNKYAVVIESSNPAGASFLNGFLAYLTKTPVRIGFADGRGSIFTNLHISPDRSQHYYVIQQELVNFLSIDKNYFKPKLYPDPNGIKDIRKLFDKNFSCLEKDKIIGLWIGARGKKKWDIENFKELYHRIKSETDYSPILAFGIEEDKDYQNIDTKKYNAIKITELHKLKSFIAACDVFVCGDTGPLHFSFALGTPTIGVFLENNYVRYGYTDGEKNDIVKPAANKEIIANVISKIKKVLD